MRMNPVFAEYWTDLEVLLPVCIGGLVAAAVITVAFVKWSRRPKVQKEPVASKPVRPEVDTWEHPEQLYGDQRTSVRRQGALVPVIIASPTFKKGTRSGIVVDRSTGGLRIATQVAIESGSPIQIIPRDAAEGTQVIGDGGERPDDQERGQCDSRGYERGARAARGEEPHSERPQQELQSPR